MSSSNLSLLPGVNHLISLKQAKEMTALYRNEKENILKPEFQGKNVLLTCETFDRSAFDEVLAQSKCAGVRIYFGMNADLTIKVIVVGVDSENKDILPTNTTAAITSGGGIIVEEGRPCPDFCPDPPL